MSIKYTFISTDGEKCDIVTLPKDVIKNATLTSEGFEEVFFSQARTSSSYMEAYEKVEAWHEDTFGRRKYSDYNSFRNAKTQRHKSK